jgi:hypothetical protein
MHLFDLPAKAPEPTTYQCRHIKPNGIRCGSPSLRHEHFCYYHHTSRKSGPRQPQVRTLADRKSSTFDLPSPADLADRSGIQLAIGQLLHKVAHNEIDPRRAGLLLYGLQIASGNLPRDRKDKKEEKESDRVDEIVEDATHGPLAPEADWEEVSRGPVTRLYHELMRKMQEREEQAEREAFLKKQHEQYQTLQQQIEQAQAQLQALQTALENTEQQAASREEQPTPEAPAQSPAQPSSQGHLAPEQPPQQAQALSQTNVLPKVQARCTTINPNRACRRHALRPNRHPSNSNHHGSTKRRPNQH